MTSESSGFCIEAAGWFFGSRVGYISKLRMWDLTLIALFP
jgi:hypothetical protein